MSFAPKQAIAPSLVLGTAALKVAVERRRHGTCVIGGTVAHDRPTYTILTAACCVRDRLSSVLSKRHSICSRSEVVHRAARARVNASAGTM